MPYKTRKLNRHLGGSKSASYAKNNVNDTGRKKSELVKQMSKSTKKYIERLESVTGVVGIDRFSVVDDGKCRFDIKGTRFDSKNQETLKGRLSESDLFKDDLKFKKFMDDRMLNFCKTHHNPNINQPDEFFMRFFNHCSNIFQCLGSLDEVIFLFYDAIKSDLSFLKIIKDEDRERKQKRDLDSRYQTKLREVEAFQKEVEKKTEMEKQISETPEETKKRQAEEKKTKSEIEKYVKEKENKVELLKNKKLNIEKQLRNLRRINEEDTEKYEKIKGEVDEIHRDVLKELIRLNKDTIQRLDLVYKDQPNKKEEKIRKTINTSIMTSLETKLNLRFEQLIKSLDTKLSKARRGTTESDTDLAGSSIIDQKDYVRKRMLKIKYSYIIAEINEFSKKKKDDNEYSLINFKKDFLTVLLKTYGKSKKGDNKTPIIDIDEKIKAELLKLEELEDKYKENFESNYSKPIENNKITEKDNELEELNNKLNQLIENNPVGDQSDSFAEEKKNIEAKIKQITKEKEELEKAQKKQNKYSNPDKTKSKIQILVFFLNNIFIDNIKEYALLNAGSNFKAKDHLSRELSKILNYSKYKEQIERLDRDGDFRDKLRNIGDTNFLENKIFNPIKIEKRSGKDAPAFEINELYRRLINNKDTKKNIYDYYMLVMKLEMDMESGKIKMDKKFEKDTYGPNLYMYIVLGFLATALSFEYLNYNNVQQALETFNNVKNVKNIKNIKKY